MIAVPVLKAPSLKAPFRTSLVPAPCFDQIPRTEDASTGVAQMFVVQEVWIEQDLVKDHPFVSESGGSGSKAMLFGGVEKFVDKVLAQTVIMGLIIEVTNNQDIRIRIFPIDRIDNFAQCPGQTPALVAC